MYTTYVVNRIYGWKRLFVPPAGKERKKKNRWQLSILNHKVTEVAFRGFCWPHFSLSSHHTALCVTSVPSGPHAPHVLRHQKRVTLHSNGEEHGALLLTLWKCKIETKIQRIWQLFSNNYLKKKIQRQYIKQEWKTSFKKNVRSWDRGDVYHWVASAPLLKALCQSWAGWQM